MPAARPFRWLAMLAAAAVLAATPSALADADPASDVLLTDDVYFPYDTKISQELKDALSSQVGKANARRYRIKVAVIEERLDLGGIPSLFGKPKQYAHFLGLELSATYKGRLLVVMPAGFGFYYGKKAFPKTEKMLRKIRVQPTGDGLVKAATAAVKQLAAHPKLK